MQIPRGFGNTHQIMKKIPQIFVWKFPRIIFLCICQLRRTGNNRTNMLVGLYFVRFYPSLLYIKNGNSEFEKWCRSSYQGLILCCGGFSFHFSLQLVYVFLWSRMIADIQISVICYFFNNRKKKQHASKWTSLAKILTKIFTKTISNLKKIAHFIKNMSPFNMKRYYCVPNLP